MICNLIKYRKLFKFVFVAILMLFVLSANLFLPYDPLWGDLKESLQPPSIKHFFGVDLVGRDVFVRVIYGIRISLLIAISTQFFSLLIGITLGALSGYFHDTLVDRVISYVLAVVWGFPFLLLVLAITTAIGPGVVQIIVAISLVNWVGIARVVRGEFISLKERQYVLAARAAGVKNGRIIFRHILPNAMTPITVIAVFGIVDIITIEAGLSFLGFGVQPPSPSLGKMIFEGKDFIQNAWWQSVFPGLALTIIILFFNSLGDKLNRERRG